MWTSQRIALVAGAVLLAVVLVGVAVMQVTRRETAQEPGPTATATGTAIAGATPSEPGDATPSPSAQAAATAPVSEPPSADELAAVFTEIEEEVESIRELPAPDIGPAELLSRTELREFLTDEFEAEYTQEARDADNVTLRALGVLEPDQDIADLQLALLGGSVIGFYDDEDKRMAVISNAGLNEEALRTYAHEYTHALQDAAFGIPELELDIEGDDDGAMARLSLLEGDATLTMELWFAQYFDPADVSGGGDPGEDPGGLPPGTPEFLIQSLFFPYTTGAEFVFTLYQEGGYDAVDAAYADPPESTEQILHPELYFADELPVDVQLPDLAAELGSGWEQVESTPVGEATLAIMVNDLANGGVNAEAAAEGWGGDRLIVAAGPDESFALAWKLAWDTPEHAAEFAAIYREAAAGLDFPAEVVELPDGTVLVAQASSEELVQSVIAIAD